MIENNIENILASINDIYSVKFAVNLLLKAKINDDEYQKSNQNNEFVTICNNFYDIKTDTIDINCRNINLLI